MTPSQLNLTRCPYGQAFTIFCKMLAQETDDCILWPYLKTKMGYGMVSLGECGHHHNNMAHRLAWTMTHHKLPSTSIRQRCGNLTCFNPRHLEEYQRVWTRNPRIAELLKLSTQDTNNCVLWPHYRIPNPRTGEAGYGQVSLRHGKKILTSRATWLANGRIIPPKEDICHSCDNPGCVNLRHLFTGTRKKNMEDCQRKGRNFIPQGTANWKAKLTENQVKEIRALYRPWDRNFSCSALAVLYGNVVTERAIRGIVKGETWKHLL